MCIFFVGSFQRSVAEVEWMVLPEKRNRYRVGHNGKVRDICTLGLIVRRPCCHHLYISLGGTELAPLMISPPVSVACDTVCNVCPFK